MICYKAQLGLKKNAAVQDVWTAFARWYVRSKSVFAELKKFISAYQLSDGTFEKDFFPSAGVESGRKTNLKILFMEYGSVLGIRVTEYGQKSIYRFSIVFSHYR